MLKQTIGQFLKSKTNWLGISMVIGGIFSIVNDYKAGLPISEESFKSILAGFALIFVRDGIAGIKNAK